MGQDTLKVGIVGSREYENRKEDKRLYIQTKNERVQTP